MDVSEFDAFELRVRGDGRKFIANVQSPGLARKDDVWQCFMFTRGGPEWENITVCIHKRVDIRVPNNDIFIFLF